MQRDNEAKDAVGNSGQPADVLQVGGRCSFSPAKCLKEGGHTLRLAGVWDAGGRK